MVYMFMLNCDVPQQHAILPFVVCPQALLETSGLDLFQERLQQDQRQARGPGIASATDEPYLERQQPQRPWRKCPNDNGSDAPFAQFGRPLQSLCYDERQLQVILPFVVCSQALLGTAGPDESQGPWQQDQQQAGRPGIQSAIDEPYRELQQAHRPCQQSPNDTGPDAASAPTGRPLHSRCQQQPSPLAWERQYPWAPARPEQNGGHDWRPGNGPQNPSEHAPSTKQARSRARLKNARLLEPWPCDQCTYMHKGILAKSVACTMCGKLRRGTIAACAKSQQENLCVVCLERPVTTAVVPCGHMCGCSQCLGNIRCMEKRPSCPICRGKMSSLLRIYHQ